MNKFIQTAILAAVGLMLTLSLLLPIVNASTAETRTYENEGIPYAAFDGEEHIIIVARDASGNVSITSDGNECELPDFSLYGAATLVYGDDGMVRFFKGTGSSDGINVWTSTVNGYIGLTAGETATITVTSTGATAVKDNVTKSGTFTPSAIIAEEGFYRLTLNPCVAEDSIIIAGQTTISGNTNWITFFGHGTIDDFVASTGYVQSSDSLTVSDVDTVINTTTKDGDLKRIDSVVFTATMSDNSEWVGTYTYFLAPASVTYDNPDLVSSDLASLLNLLPLLCVVAIVLAVVTYTIRARA